MTIAKSIKNALVPIHPAGYPFIAGFFLGALVLGLIFEPLFWIGLGLTAWCAYFFRNPERVTPVNDDEVVAPADGRISYVGKAVPPAELELGAAKMLRISVFMNVFDCHINRTPMTGAVKRIVYRTGKFVNAELDKASSENERNALIVETVHGDMAVVQIAGLIARRIVCFANKGDALTTGERFGLIRFGSRLDVYLPEGATAKVALGQTAIGGETVLARFNDDGAPPLIRVS